MLDIVLDWSSKGGTKQGSAAGGADTAVVSVRGWSVQERRSWPSAESWGIGQCWPGEEGVGRSCPEREWCEGREEQSSQSLAQAGPPLAPRVEWSVGAQQPASPAAWDPT